MPYGKTNSRSETGGISFGAIMNRDFWKNALIRAVKTFAQSAVAVLAASATGLLTVDWLNLLSIAGLAAVLSIFTSIASIDTIATTPAAPTDAPTTGD